MHWNIVVIHQLPLPLQRLCVCREAFSSPIKNASVHRYPISELHTASIEVMEISIVSIGLILKPKQWLIRMIHKVEETAYAIAKTNERLVSKETVMPRRWGRNTKLCIGNHMISSAIWNK